MRQLHMCDAAGMMLVMTVDDGDSVSGFSAATSDISSAFANHRTEPVASETLSTLIGAQGAIAGGIASPGQMSTAHSTVSAHSNRRAQLIDY